MNEETSDSFRVTREGIPAYDEPTRAELRSALREYNANAWVRERRVVYAYQSVALSLACLLLIALATLAIYLLFTSP